MKIGYDQLEPEDLEMLAPLFGFTDVQTNALYMLRRRLGKDWVQRLLDEDTVSSRSCWSRTGSRRAA